MAINGVRLEGSEYIEINGLIGLQLEADLIAKRGDSVKCSLDW